jgi:hypothetical protein
MDNTTLDQLRLAYKQAVDQWVDAIHAEEALATPNHSEVAWEHWDAASLAEQDLQSEVQKARDAYKNALREANFGF